MVGEIVDNKSIRKGVSCAEKTNVKVRKYTQGKFKSELEIKGERSFAY